VFPKLIDGGNLKKRSPIRVACVGASTTKGGLGSGDPYPSILQKMLGDDYAVSNLGVAGRTISKNDEISYWKTPAFEQLSKSKWDIVVNLFYGNDGKDMSSGFKRDIWQHHLCDTGTVSTRCPYWTSYRSWIDFLRTLGSPDIFIGTPLPVTGPNNFSVNMTVTNGVIRKMIPKIAAESDIGPDHVIDMFAELAGDSLGEVPKNGCSTNMSDIGVCPFFCDEELCDQLHPTAAGKQKIAAVIADAIWKSRSLKSDSLRFMGPNRISLLIVFLAFLAYSC